jgi:hypothetical protein
LDHDGGNVTAGRVDDYEHRVDDYDNGVDDYDNGVDDDDHGAAEGAEDTIDEGRM